MTELNEYTQKISSDLRLLKRSLLNRELDCSDLIKEVKKDIVDLSQVNFEETEKTKILREYVERMNSLIEERYPEQVVEI